MPYDTFLTFLDEPALILKIFLIGARRRQSFSLDSKDPKNDDFEETEVNVEVEVDVEPDLDQEFADVIT